MSSSAGEMKTFRQYISHLLQYKVIHIIFHSYWTYKLHVRTHARLVRPAPGTRYNLFVSRTTTTSRASTGAGLPCRSALYRARRRPRYTNITVTRQTDPQGNSDHTALAHSETAPRLDRANCYCIINCNNRLFRM